jgi:hypothetical protein
MRHEDHEQDVTLVMHARDVPPGLLRSTIRTMGITVEEFQELLK